MVREAHTRHSLWQALKHPRLLLLGLVYFGNAAANYGLGFWLPTIVKGFGVSNLQTGFITAIPYVVGRSRWCCGRYCRTGCRSASGIRRWRFC
jgi:hypothetical protein